MGIVAVPAIAAPSQVLPVLAVDQLTSSVVIANPTFYRLWVRLGGPNNPPVPDPTTRAQWAYEVMPQTIEKFNAPAGWDGLIWLGVFAPYGPVATNVVQYATIGAYQPGEAPDIASSAGAALFAQQRVLAVPALPSAVVGVDVPGPGAGTNLELCTLLGPGAGSPFTITAYLYALSFAQIGLRWSQFLIAWAVVTTGPTYTVYPNPPGELFTGRAWAGRQWTMPSVPSGVQIPLPSSYLRVVLVFNPVASWPAPGGIPALPTAIDGVAMMGVDLTGQVPPPGIGNGANTLQGVIY